MALETLKTLETLKIILMGVLMLGTAHAERQRYCPVRGHSAVIQFSKTPATLAFGCRGHYAELHCCMDGFDTINWYQQTSDSTPSWRDFLHFKTRERFLTEQNQTAVFEEADIARDKGIYKCIGYKLGSPDKTNIVNNTVNFTIQRCAGMRDAPIALLPSEDNKTYELHHGQDLKVPCQGFFGYYQKSQWGILWERWIKGRVHSINSNCNTGRVCALDKKINQNTTLEQTLQITNATAEDNGEYQCHLSNGFPTKEGKLNTVRTFYLTVAKSTASHESVRAIVTSLALLKYMAIIMECFVEINM